MTEINKKSSSGWSGIVSPLADCLTMAAYLYLLPWLAKSFLTPSWINGLIIIVAFIGLLVAIQALKELTAGKRRQSDLPQKSAAKSESENKKSDNSACCSVWFWTMFCSFFYCGFLALVFLATATGADLNSNDSDTAGAMLLLGSAMLVLLVIILPVFGKAETDSPGGLLMHAISVLGIAMITIVGMAFWESLKLADSEPGGEIFHGIWKLLMFLILLLVFAGFVGMPRIYLHLVKGDRWGLVTYMASLGYYVWDLFEF